MPENKEEAKAEKQVDAEFRAEQKALAAAQGLTADNAVPEQRPTASQETLDYHQSETFLKLREAGELQAEPMGKEAYDRAASSAQAKAAAKEERTPTIRPGARVKITDGPYEGNYGAVLEVNYATTEDERTQAAGTPESRFAEVESLLVRTRGGRHALLSLEPDQVQEVEVLVRGEA